jgi:uncharacterized protein YidB (DUF937 family)
MTALLGLLAVAGYQNRHRIGELLGQATGQATPRPGEQGRTTGAPSGGGLLGLLGGAGGGGLLGGLLGGAGGSPAGMLSGGIGDLLDRFKANGKGDVAQSWVSTGPNQDIDRGGLEQALGEDTIQSLTQQTGLSREELLSRLQTVLPTAVDKLTPEGRVPSEQETAHWT